MMKKIKYSATEDQEAIALFEWAQTQPIVRDFIIHIPNGGSRTKNEGRKFKKIGVRPGVSDYFLPLPNGYYAGLWIELKRKGGKLTKEQKDWLIAMHKLGYWAECAYGADEAIRIISLYMNRGMTQDYQKKDDNKNNGSIIVQ